MSKTDRYLFQAFEVVEKAAEDSADFSFGPPDEPTKLPILIQVADPNWQPEDLPDIIITSRLGNIIACQGSRETIAALSKDPNVLSIEASRSATNWEGIQSVSFVGATSIHQPPLSEKGDSVLIAIIDSGIDVLHDAFLDGQGQTRLVAIWDQTDPSGPAPTTPLLSNHYGTEHTAQQINQYIQQQQVPAGLGRDLQKHGTHVASIAAGRAGQQFGGGVAPEAKILLVIPKLSVGPNDPLSIGYSNSHQDALVYIKNVAKDLGLPVVVNVSLGMNAGAHDGNSLLEAGFDSFSEGGRKPGHIIVKSAGNERGFDGHAKVTMNSNSADALELDSTKLHNGPDTIEVWFMACDELKFRLRNPNNETSPWVSWTDDFVGNGKFGSGNRYTLSYERFHHDNGDSRFLATIMAGPTPGIAPGKWVIEIESGVVRSAGVLHAWLERDNSRPIRFLNHSSEEMTLSVPGTARTIIAVGSTGAAMPSLLGSYSSYGPTRDKRERPDIVAPGENIVAALAGSANNVVAMSGTSMAAPHVTGAIALLLSRWSKTHPNEQQLNAVQVRAALTQTTQNFNGRWSEGAGYGVLDVKAILSVFA